MKLVPLTNRIDQFAKVSDEDFDRVMKRRWYAVTKHRGKNTYAFTYNPTDKMPLPMHRFILSLKKRDALCTDHINHDCLDNRRENIRICTPKENLRNRVKQTRCGKPCLSQFKGVSFRCGKWEARLKNFWGGRFTSETEAARKYDELARLHFGAFAYLNFPDADK